MTVEELVLRDRAAWRRWLVSRGQESAGEWLVLARKGKDAPTRLSYDDALEEALCFGWIDGQKRSRDEASFVQRFTPRRSRSSWSRRNVALAFDRLSSQNRYAVLLRIDQAKRADTRLRRIEAFAAMLARGEAPHPQSSPILPDDSA
ncbi:MAG: YdeI/OmpD-associated family protein [Actinomycetota bacterium]|nr:YdeI/OmpD-associated family protein [Actinomycetota bacterium]